MPLLSITPLLAGICGAVLCLLAGGSLLFCLTRKPEAGGDDEEADA